MKYYQNVERPLPEYVAPIDVQYVDKVNSTLEQGHLKGVELASKLRSEIAQLPLNESEAGYKDELANGIENVINDSTIQGNMYYTIPQLIKAQGDIMSNPVLLNKIKAQEDYTKFRDSVDNNNELTSDMKEYYKELNPYRSGQRPDGTYDTTFKWNPTNSPKKVVDLNKMVTQGIQRAAVEAGGGSVTRWLDADGNITNDPSKAYDGEVYDVTTGEYKRLTREKILAGIQSVIAETPGAQESLQQDYDVARWKLSKQPTTDANGNPIIPVSDVTDKNGVILTPQEYLMLRIAPAVQAAEFYNRSSKTTYGNGLATYRAARQKAAAGELANAQYQSEMLTGSARGMILSIPQDAGGDAVNNMNTAKASIASAYKSITGNDLMPTSYEDLSKAVEEIKENLTPTQFVQMSNLLTMYKSADATLQAFTKDMSEKDKKEYDFAIRMLNGGGVIADATKHDKRIINAYKDKFDNNGNLSIIAVPAVINNFRNIIGNPTDYGVTITDEKIIINKENENYIPQILSYVADAYKRSEHINFGGAQNTIAPYFEGSAGKNISTDWSKINGAGNEYKKAKDISDKYSKKYGVGPNNIDVAVTLYPGATWSDQYYDAQYELGLLDRADYNVKKERMKDYIENSLHNIAGSQYPMWVQNKDRKGIAVTSSKDRANVGSEINSAIKDNRISYQPAYAPAAVDPLHNELGGYYITIYKDDDKKTVDKRIYVPGLGGESGRELIMTNPKVIAENDLTVAAQTGAVNFLTVAEETPVLGNISLQAVSPIAGNEIFGVNFMGDVIPMSKGDAADFIEKINNYKQIKHYYQAGGQLNARTASALNDILQTVSRTTGYDTDALNLIFGNDMEQ